jgi:hypothetical protein
VSWVLLSTGIRTIVLWISLYLLELNNPQLHWQGLTTLGLALLGSLAEFLAIDFMPVELPPVGRALEALLAITALSFVAFHHLVPHLTPHQLLIMSGSLALAAAALEWLLARLLEPRLTIRR